MNAEDADRLEGCLLGAALGDAIGLPFEGLSARRIQRMASGPLRHRLLLGRGMVSDDTDHSLFVLEALAEQPESEIAFADAFAWRLKRWLMCLPAGIGLATIRAGLRLCLGCSSRGSGVWSAGNGAAMRAPVLGVALAGDPVRRRSFVEACARVTHRDPRAVIGALALAEVSALTVRLQGELPSTHHLQEVLLGVAQHPEWQAAVARTMRGCETGGFQDPHDGRGVSGYVFETVPASLVAWYHSGGRVREAVEAAVRMGGDTDTVASIAGALAGASQGASGLPTDWLEGLVDYPHSVSRMRQVVADLAAGRVRARMFPWALFPRGVVFTAAVLTHGFRRCFPPYG